jgi:hypothetical protein
MKQLIALIFSSTLVLGFTFSGCTNKQMQAAVSTFTGKQGNMATAKKVKMLMSIIKTL